ncbi:hypothetical protein [Acaryochloris sp. IP29b_bin.137]|uniref:hypothetical protein n=1 Tax=Acaryochloris sp. IP29b_bin.137 TaxID=2969217 RepID=UPI00262EB19E|nr:hypothetical protein [Acaryochloris sp. IP29b_bin.137]
MKHYRRKPLQLLEQGLPESVADLVDQVETLSSRDTPSADLPTAPDALAETLAKGIQPGDTEVIPSPDALVQQAAAILDSDRLTPLPSAQTVASPFNLGTPAPSAPSSYSVQSLAGEMHEFVNELANLIALKSDLMEGGTGNTPSKDATVPLLQPAYPSHAGETVQISFKAHNDSTETIQAKFFCTDLYNGQGDRIPEEAISITPKTLSLAPDAVDSIGISIQLPQSLPHGEYSGVLMAPELSYLKAMIAVTVT